MTKNEFIDWKNDPRTKEVFVAIKSECFIIAERLARVAGLDDKSDRYEAGVIRGMERLLDVEFEEGESADDKTVSV